MATQFWIHRRNIQAWEEYLTQSFSSTTSASISLATVNGTSSSATLDHSSFLSQRLQSFKATKQGEFDGGGLGAGDATDTHMAKLLLQDWDWNAVAQHGQSVAPEGTLLPTWMKEYFAWHQATLATLQAHPETYQDYHYFIMRCLDMDGDRCGDLSHRLQSVPIALSLANAASPRRLLFIKWEQPAALENFLLPPIAYDHHPNPNMVRTALGIDWRLPTWLDDKLSPDYENAPTIMGNSAYAIAEVHDPANRLVMMRHLTRDHGSRLYNDFRQVQYSNASGIVISKEPSFELVFRHVWQALFQLSPPVQELYEKNVQALQLTTTTTTTTSSTITGSGRGVQLQPFLLLHMPDFSEGTKADVAQIIVNGAVSCVKNLLTDTNQERNNNNNTTTISLPAIQQVVVTSQSIDMIQAAMTTYHDPQHMIALKTREDLLDLDYSQDTEWYRNHSAPGYYNQVFAYMHLWTHAECIVYGNEGDGNQWKFLLIRNPRCAAQFKHRRRNFCHIVSAQDLVPPLPKDKVNQLLLANGKSAAALVNNNDNTKGIRGRHRPAQKAIAAVAANAASSYNFVPSPEFPEWMNEYFAWHGEERTRLTQKNWKTYKYLVVRCLDVDDKCGGASDRLQSLPLAILFASLSGRLLLIHWERPCPLQEFLVPPKGGLDWRMPSWLHEKLDYAHAIVIVMTAFKPVMMNTPLVTMRHQKFWPEFYDQRKLQHERSYQDVFHAVWQRVFEPTLPIQALIEKHMREMNLAKGKYVAVHVRAKYIRDLTKDTKGIENALNCASTLRPGYPIYVASDSTQVIRMAMEYGQSKGATVVARTDEHEPLHLDRGAAFLNHRNRRGAWQDHSASQYYDVFIDLYLLGDSECLTHGYGGYGRLGSLLSYNQTCSINHMEEICTWHGKEDATGGGGVAVV
jgi:hypothetical protein